MCSTQLIRILAILAKVNGVFIIDNELTESGENLKFVSSFPKYEKPDTRNLPHYSGNFPTNETKGSQVKEKVSVEVSLCKAADDCQSIKTANHNLKRNVRSKRSIDPETPVICEMEVIINAFENNYTLCLFSKSFKNNEIVENTYDNINMTVFKEGNSSHTIPLSALELEYIVGYVVEDPYSSVDGYLLNQHFFGIIYIQDKIHYLEPSLKKSQDLHIYLDGMKTFEEETSKNCTKTSCEPRVCELTIVADHLFYQQVGKGSLHNTVMLMLWHVKEANRFFAVADFDSDGVSDCVRLTVGEITIFTEENSTANLLAGHFPVPEDFLKRFSRYNFDGFCLGALFTSREFEDLVLGLAWRGSTISDGVGGACQSRVRIKSDVNAYSFNSLFVSLKSQQDKRIPVKMGVLNLVHEILHAIGAKHDPDPEERPDCTPLDKHFNGRFLMSKFSNDGHKLNHQIMSPCTKESVSQMVNDPSKLKCLRPVNVSVCGNGLVEEGEECDCGTAFMCTASRSCCTSPEGHGHILPCKKRTKVPYCVP